jgi:hypothetical protein
MNKILPKILITLATIFMELCQNQCSTSPEYAGGKNGK